MTTLAEVNGLDRRTQELIKQVKLGNDVVLTEANTPVARIVPVATESKTEAPTSLKFQSFHLGSKKPLESKSELADEMISPP